MEDNLKKARKYCKQIFQKSRCELLPFHNLNHTLEVYNNVKTISVFEKIPISDLNPLLLAALFHDTGNAFRFQGHEEVSVSYAILFMEKNGYEEDIIDLVSDYIKATRMPQEPKNHLEKIICDADLFHLGTTSFMTKNKLIRQEWEKFLELRYTDEAWYVLNIDFLKQHQFHTSYGKEILEPIKQQNLSGLKSKLLISRKDEVQ
ncbi:HD domain-containing protein [Maribacter sp.]|nr:HD domain-containing protein [Maribacter sp.]